MSETREHIIRLADRLIRQRGFNAFSYADIAAVLNIRKAAVHYHFATKSLLGQAVIEEELRRVEGYRQAHPKLGGDLQIRHLVGVFFHNSQCNAVCLMGALTPEFATFDAGMQAMVQRLCVAIREWVGDCLEDARSAGWMRFGGSAMDRAALVVSTLLSSLLLSRVEGAGLFCRMIDRLLEDLGAGWRVGDLPAIGPARQEGLYSFT
ncbi:MAG TPA: TetR/AcrR family transcriptional regulator [Puia sp.]|uniref:TetR/AcrR family transcriptional regulator n=1 Tax=Puia sp. TaxID=2045100 RepID=UPI002BA98602|nr:TetR/AcrR family transcriptional regulator [Puia sp.]HVU97821.1 TetR/AcrR family transcriptional regulator [Puia sp.]